ncbi:MAG: replicative helicase [Acidobacteriota bacterium]|jgi:replicative DNA helicase|nr:replicative helicase [Acidobacteriota bacterium]
MANFVADSARDQMLERPLPNSTEAERAILGAIILDNALINQAIELLKPEDFYVPSHRRIFLAMIALFEHGSEINPILIAEELRRDAAIESVGGVSFISNLHHGLPHFANIAHYAKIVRDKSMLRQLVKVCNKVTSEALEEEDEAEIILDHAEQAIFALADERTRQGFAHVKPIADAMLEHVQEMAGRSAMLTGLTTGFNDLDSMLSGLQASDLIVVAARPSMGKTALCLTLAQNAAIQAQAVVGIFSLEMSKESLVMRMLSSEGRVDAHRFRSGFLSRDEWARLAGALGALAETKIFIDDTPGITVLEMRAKARRLAAEQKKLDLIIVDYLQLMSGSARRVESRQQEVSQISRELKGLAKELNVPVIALSQLSRAPENRTDHRPQLADLRECVTGDTLVLLASGARVPIAHLVGTEPEVLSLSAEGRIIPAQSDKVWRVGIRPVFDVQLASGRRIRATAKHRLRGWEGWMRVDELQPGDRLAVARQLPEPQETLSWPDARVTLLGQLIGDGSYLKQQPMRYTTSSEENSCLMRAQGISTRQMATLRGTTYGGLSQFSFAPSRALVAKYSLILGDDKLATRSSDDIFWDRVVAIEPAGEEEVYDLTVPGPESWLADGIVSHNSGAIEQDADVVAFIYREEQYNRTEENAGIAEIIIAKQRNGPTGVAKLAFLKEFTRFENMWRE